MMTLAELRQQFPVPGRVEWIGVRPAKDEPMATPHSVELKAGAGITGDRFAARRTDKRAVTLIQAEHVQAIAQLLQREALDPAELRRNIVVSGLNLLALKETRFQLGGAVLRMTGLCHPCSKMERRLGPGAYNAMRGHGGITACVLSGGIVSVGDSLRAARTS